MNSKMFNYYATVFALVVLLFASGCKKNVEVKEPSKSFDPGFSGQIVDEKGSPIENVTILINGVKAETDKKGHFDVKPDSSGRYVVTIKKHGFGLISKVFYRPKKDGQYILQPVFTTTIDPTKANVIRDLRSATACKGTGFQNIRFDKDYQKIPLIYDPQGHLVDFGFPAGMEDVFKYMTSAPQCNPGATITIPANSIVTLNNQSVTSPVTIAINTIDLESPDGMPGDYTYLDENGRQGYMVSMGAVGIEVYSDKEDYQLNGKEAVKLSLPIDPGQLRFNKQIPESIPLLYYNEKDGTWRQEKEQVGRLNKKRDAYEAELKHFSVINMDYKMPDRTCMRLRQDPINAAGLVSQFKIGMLSPTYGYRNSTTSGDEASSSCSTDADGANIHLVINMPKNEYVGVVMTDMSGTVLPYGIAVHQTANITYDPATIATCRPCNAGDPCYDAGVGECPEDCTTNDCSYLKLKQFSQDVIAAAKRNGTNVIAKWIFKTPLANGTSYSYTVQQLRNDNSIATSNTGNLTYLTANPIQEVSVAFLDTPANPVVKVVVVANAITSNEAGL